MQGTILDFGPETGAAFDHNSETIKKHDHRDFPHFQATSRLQSLRDQQKKISSEFVKNPKKPSKISQKAGTNLTQTVHINSMVSKAQNLYKQYRNNTFQSQNHLFAEDFDTLFQDHIPVREDPVPKPE
jgi:hypothetical protein